MQDIQVGGGNGPSIAGLAQQVAVRSSCERVGTQHILLALVKLTDSVAGRVLAAHSVSLNKLEETVDRMSKGGIREEDHKISAKRIASCNEHGHLPPSRQAEEAYTIACFDAVEWLGHRIVNSGHVLLGILRVRGCVAVRALRELGVDLDDIRNCVFDEFQD